MRAEARRHRHTGTLEDAEQRRRKKGDEIGAAVLDNRPRILRTYVVRAVLFLGVVYLGAVLFRYSSSIARVDNGFPAGLGLLRNTSDEKLLIWLESSVHVAELSRGLKDAEGRGGLKVGLINFQSSSPLRWELFTGGETPKFIGFEKVSSKVTWSDLYPEWIDEEERWNVPKCPELPMPRKQKNLKLDLVVAKVPCSSSSGNKNWSRDVNRLHILLVAARVALDTGQGDNMHVVLVDECWPAPNMFTCNELLEHEESFWLFKVDRQRLSKILSLPVGSCELSVPLGVKLRASRKNAAREAYATILHSAQLYVCGAISLAQSIRKTGSTRDLVILVDENIHPHHREGLESAGWKVIQIQRIRNPKAEPDSYNEWNYSKFRLWQLTQYSKLIYIDADIIVLRNLDFLFRMPEISATGNHESLFNSGVMVIEPSNCTFEFLMQHIEEVESYNGGDQGYLNEVYTWWHRLPKHMNFLKHFGVNDTEELEHRLELFTAEPPKLFAMHFLGLKPWLCFRDYDCNWNQRKLHEYANDAVHARWWRIHDSMPKKLRQYCLLRSKQKASLEWDRRQAAKEKYEDGHWKIKIQDSRLRTCFEDFCYWESMLWHWGETNDTGAANSTKS